MSRQIPTTVPAVPPRILPMELKPAVLLGLNIAPPVAPVFIKYPVPKPPADPR